MDNGEFIVDTAKDFGLDVTVRSKEIQDEPKTVYQVSTRQDGEKYMTEFVVGTDDKFEENQLLMKKLQDALNAIESQMNGDEPTVIE